MIRKRITDITSSLFILLWLYAGLSKLTEFETFRNQLGKSPFISSFAPVIAWALPAGEIILAVILMRERTVKIGLYISFFLMCLFSAYIIAMLKFSYYIPCSCGGIISRLDWVEHLWFNVGFIVIALAGIINFSLPGYKGKTSLMSG